MGHNQFRNPPSVPVAEADIRAELQSILSSPAFANQERLQQFLVHVTERTLEGRATELKETTIGFEVFERRADYDVKSDAIVRVQARRLRGKLAEYYESPDHGARILVTIPKGGYVPEFELITATPAGGVTSPERRGESAVEAPPPKAESRGDRRVLYFTLGIVATICTAVLTSLYRPPAHHPAAVRIRQFAGGRGTYNHPAFSPDGRSLAFDWDGPDFDNTDIYIQALDSDTPQRLTTGPEEESRPVWSPDGKQIAFVRRLPEHRAAIVVIPARGGSDRIVSVMEWVGDLPKVDWSPDGATFVTSRIATPQSPTYALTLISADSGSQHVLTNPAWGPPGDTEAAFSPDGSWIAFERAKDGTAKDVFIIPARGGEVRQLTSDNTFLSGLAWTRDSRGIVFGSTRDGGSYAFWRVLLPGGAPVRISATGGSAAFPNMSPHGDRIAFAVRIEDPNIWRLDLDAPASKQRSAGLAPASAVIQSTSADANPALSPDGNLLAFRSSRTENSEIWISDVRGAHARRLTNCNGGWCGSPDWSPDGKQIAYEATRDGSPQVFIISRDGGDARRLSSESGSETRPHWSRDGRSIYYSSNISGRSEIWKRPTGGGPAIQITHGGGLTGQESFDSHSLYFTGGELHPGLWRQPLDGGPEEKVAAQLLPRVWGNWRATRNGVYFMTFIWEQRPFTQTLYFFDAGTHQVREVGRVPGIAMPGNAGLAVSPDERSIYFVQVDHWGVGIYFVEEITW